MLDQLQWLQDIREPASLSCVYCGFAGGFAHEGSYAFNGIPWHLHKCPQCGSLTYDMVMAATLPMMDIPAAEYVVNGRYYLQTGYSADFIVLCALAALGELREEELGGYIFFDVGAGIGLGSYFVQQAFGAEVLAIEPAQSGRLGAQIFDINLRPDFFEDLSPDVMRNLQSKPCLVHLNSVVEHLVDPRATLEGLVGRLNVETLAIVVPDAAVVGRSVPLLDILPTLSPNEHLHLPTSEGVIRLLTHLGFTHHAVYTTGSLMVAVGGRRPVSIPSHRTVALARDLLLERLIHHPHPHVAGGAAARLLPRAVSLKQRELLTLLRARFATEIQPKQLLGRLAKDRNWEQIPFHLAPTCFWLAVDARSRGVPSEALAYLDVVSAFADRLAAEYPQYCAQSQLYKWESFLLRADILRGTGALEAARAVLVRVTDSAADPRAGANAEHLRRAREALAAL